MLSTRTFEPDNIMRYVSVKTNNNGGVDVNVDWSQIMQLVEATKIPLERIEFSAVAEEAISQHVIKNFGIDPNKPRERQIQVLPYLVAYTIFITAGRMLEKMSTAAEGEDTGYDDVDEDKRVSNDQDANDAELQSILNENPGS